MTFLESIKENNQYPIIFIGSGITQRYYKDSPKWDQLLHQMWIQTYSNDNFYGKFSQLKKSCDSEFDALTKMATLIASDYDDLFYNGEVILDNLTQEQAYSNSISPFKQAIANIFANLEQRDGVEDELKSLSAMLKNARMIVTTNYDLMIETLVDNAIKVNVGGSSLFKQTNNMNELYKIHGSIDVPNSIVISEEDYKKSDRETALVNAIILSNLIDTPILFLGYSITDNSIKSLLCDFSDNLPNDISLAISRIGVVAWDPDNSEVTESIAELPDLNIHYTNLRTDNFKKIYDTVASIDQGLTPREIALYQDSIRNIIKTEGHNANLSTILVSSVDIDKLPEEVKSRKIAIALASNETVSDILRMPVYVDYIKAYFLKDVNFKLSLSLDFIRSKSFDEMLPVASVVKEANATPNLSSTYAEYNSLKDKITRRNNHRPNLDKILESIKLSNQYKKRFSKLQEEDFCTPLALYESVKNNGVSDTRNMVIYITLNIKTFDIDDLQKFTEYLIDTIPPQTLKISDYRKFFLAYSYVLDPTPIELEQ